VVEAGAHSQAHEHTRASTRAQTHEYSNTQTCLVCVSRAPRGHGGPSAALNEPPSVGPASSRASLQSGQSTRTRPAPGQPAPSVGRIGPGQHLRSSRSDRTRSIGPGGEGDEGTGSGLAGPENASGCFETARAIRALQRCSTVRYTRMPGSGLNVCCDYEQHRPRSAGHHPARSPAQRPTCIWPASGHRLAASGLGLAASGHRLAAAPARTHG